MRHRNTKARKGTSTCASETPAKKYAPKGAESSRRGIDEQTRVTYNMVCRRRKQLILENGKESKNMRKLTKKELQEFIKEYNETCAERASDEVIKADTRFRYDLDEYIAEVSEDYFSKGFRYALRMVEEGRI